MCRLWLWEFQQKPPELTRDSIPQQLAISSQRQPIQVYKLGRSLKRKTKQNPRSPMLRGIWIYTDLRTTIWLHTMSMSFFGKYEINDQLEVTLLGLWPNSNPRWQHIWYPQISQMCCNSSSRWFVEKTSHHQKVFIETGSPSGPAKTGGVFDCWPSKRARFPSKKIWLEV